MQPKKRKLNATKTKKEKDKQNKQILYLIKDRQKEKQNDAQRDNHRKDWTFTFSAFGARIYQITMNYNFEQLSFAEESINDNLVVMEL